MTARLTALVPLLLDVVVPVASYYLLHALGVTDFWALTLAGAVTATWAVVATIRRGRLDGVGLLVVLELVLSAVLLVVSRDARIVLLKPSFYTAAAGLYLLWTCWSRRPLSVETSRPFAVAGDPARAAATDSAWDDDPGFRREHLLITGAWGVTWLLEAAVRGAVVLGTDVATGVWASQIPGVVALVVCLVVTRVRVPRLKAAIAARLPAGHPDAASSRTPSEAPDGSGPHRPAPGQWAR